MVIFTDNEGRIKAVGGSSDPSLTRHELNEDNPFVGWSEAKICCYKVTVHDGVVTMMTPYVSSGVLEPIDRIGNGEQENSEGEFDIADMVDENSTSIFELAEMVAQLSDEIAELKGRS